MSKKLFNNMQEVYEYCKNQVFQKVSQRFLNCDTAEDVTSDIFTEIATHCEWFIRQDEKKQKDYFVHTYKKVVSKQLERERNEKVVEYKEAMYDGLLANEDRLVFMEEDAVRSNFNGLSDAEKKVAEMRYIENKSVRQIAIEENSTENAISKRLSRAKNKIKYNI